jgi:hypothetical protein
MQGSASFYRRNSSEGGRGNIGFLHDRYSNTRFVCSLSFNYFSKQRDSTDYIHACMDGLDAHTYRRVYVRTYIYLYICIHKYSQVRELYVRALHMNFTCICASLLHIYYLRFFLFQFNMLIGVSE